MKSIRYILAVIILTFGLQGCYTIIWNPDQEFPTEENTTSIYGDSFYYNDYYFFYDYPWWFRISSPLIAVDEIYDRGDSQESIRNNDGGRSGSGSPNFLRPDPPGRTSGGTSGTSNEKSTSSGSSRNGSDDSGRNTDTRNNDSGRNTDKGRR